MENQTQVNPLRGIQIATSIIAITIVVVAMKNLKAIFIPLIFAVFFSFLLSPLYRSLLKKKIPKALVLLLLIVLVFSAMYGFGILIYIGSLSFAEEFPKYEKIIISYINDFLIKMEIPFEDTRLRTQDFLKDVNWTEMWDRLSVSRIIRTTMGTFVDFIINLLMSLVFMIFIMSGKEKMLEGLSRVFNKDSSWSKSKKIIRRIEKSMATYFFNKSLISLGTALLGMFFISIFGIDFVLFSGLLLFFLNFIPNIGSIIASIFPIIVALIEFGFSWQPFAIAIILLVIQFVFGNILEPKVLGDNLDISPIVVLISLVFWAWVWGPVGMIFAIPITSVIHLILQEIPSMRIFSVFISGK